MVATMPRPRRDAKAKTSYPEFIDVFSRMDGETVRKLDELAADQKRSRSAMVAFVIEAFIDAEYPKLQAKRQAQSN